MGETAEDEQQVFDAPGCRIQQPREVICGRTADEREQCFAIPHALIERGRFDAHVLRDGLHRDRGNTSGFEQTRCRADDLVERCSLRCRHRTSKATNISYHG